VIVLFVAAGEELMFFDLRYEPDSTSGFYQAVRRAGESRAPELDSEALFVETLSLVVGPAHRGATQTAAQLWRSGAYRSAACDAFAALAVEGGAGVPRWREI
jgi:hypothetical protein